MCKCSSQPLLPDATMRGTFYARDIHLANCAGCHWSAQKNANEVATAVAMATLLLPAGRLPPRRTAAEVDDDCSVSGRESPPPLPLDMVLSSAVHENQNKTNRTNEQKK